MVHEDDRRRVVSSQVVIDRGSTVDLYWLPLGAGGHSVRLNGLAPRWLDGAFAKHRMQLAPRTAASPKEIM